MITPPTESFRSILVSRPTVRANAFRRWAHKHPQPSRNRRPELTGAEREGAAVQAIGHLPRREQEMTSGPAQDDTKRREFFATAPLQATDARQKASPMDEMNYRFVVGYGHGDARACFLYGALDEVMVTVTSDRAPSVR
jgi:hypothetical protein